MTTSWPRGSSRSRSNASEPSARTPAPSSSRCKRVVSFFLWCLAIANHRESEHFSKGETGDWNATHVDGQDPTPSPLALDLLVASSNFATEFVSGKVAKQGVLKSDRNVYYLSSRKHIPASNLLLPSGGIRWKRCGRTSSLQYS